MTKKIIPIVLVILAILFIYPSTQNTEKKLMIYLDEYLENTKEILKIDYSENGAYVYTRFSEEANVCFFMKKSYFGWKYDYDVFNSAGAPLVEQNGFSITYFPRLKKVDYPVYFGKIIDDEISRIEFINAKTGETFTPEVSSINNIRLWTMNMDLVGSEEVMISGYTADNELISEVEITEDKRIYKYYNKIKKGTMYKILDRQY